MPCHDSRDDPSYVWEQARKDFRHNSPVADMLCRMCRAAENTGSNVLAMHPDIAQWWAEHQERDLKKAREARARRQNAIEDKKRLLREIQKELESWNSPTMATWRRRCSPLSRAMTASRLQKK